MEWLSPVADIVGVMGAVFALLAWFYSRLVHRSLERERQRQDERIQVILEDREGRLAYPLPGRLRRKELTRAELLGRLGMIPMKEKTKRFNLPYLNTLEFQDRLNEVLNSKGDVDLILPCAREDIEQFDVALQALDNRLSTP